MKDNIIHGIVFVLLSSLVLSVCVIKTFVLPKDSDQIGFGTRAFPVEIYIESK